MSATVKFVNGWLGALICMASAGNGWAQTVPLADLECYRVVDTTPLKQVTLDLSGLTFPNDQGCVVKTRARYFCRPTATTVISSTGPLTDYIGQGVSDFSTCYKVRCPGGTTQQKINTDLFGVRQLTMLRPQLLCLASHIGYVYEVTFGLTTGGQALAGLQFDVSGPSSGHFLSRVDYYAACDGGPGMPSEAYMNAAVDEDGGLRVAPISLEGELTSNTSVVVCDFVIDDATVNTNEFSVSLTAAFGANLEPVSGVSVSVTSVTPK